MLVLTTIFIDVSNNLPKTSYMKMIDVWLLFNLIIPFVVVLIHTYINTMRTDGGIEEAGGEDEAEDRGNEKKIRFWERASLVYNPTIALTFASVYWIAGLRNAEII